MNHTIAVLVENQFGVLARVAGLFSARGFNIDSLAVGETNDPSISRMTITVNGDNRIVEQIMKQLNKLVDVIEVVDLSSGEIIERELVLAKVKADATTRSEIMQIVSTFRAKIVDVSPESLTVEVTGGQGKADAMLELLSPYEILEVVRTGIVALSRRDVLQAPPQEAPKSSKKETRSKLKTAK